MINNEVKKVKAGTHHKFAKENFAASERSVLSRLGKYWYLTSSGEPINVGAANYTYFLMKPTTEFTETFNLDREILCLFSPYENFEPRTLDVFDSLFLKVPKARVENLCVVLISQDKKIEEKIRKIATSSNNSEDKVIIPFTYEEIYKSTSNKVYNDRFRKVFYSKDLFSFNSPLTKDSYFFGRDKLVHELIDKHNSREHAGVFGLRKSGKTSVIYAIQRKLAIENRNVLFVDCESPSIHHLRWYELLEELVKKFHSLKKSTIKISYENRYDEKNAAKSFKEDILKIYESKKKDATLFIFDEIERITPYTSSSKHWKEEFDFIYFWQTLRSVYQENPEVYTYILVGTNPKCIEDYEFFGQDNPIFTSCSIHYLNSFHIDDVIEMVQTLGNFMGLNFEKDICAKLKDDFGGHPFLIRQVCSYIHRTCQAERPFTIDKGTYSSSLKDFKPNLYEYFDMMLNILGVWYPDEYDMLVMLALEDLDDFYDLAKDNPTIVKHLLSFSLLDKGYGNTYSLSIESLDDYLNDKNKFRKLNLTSEDMQQEISLRRNRLEKKLREILLTGLKFRYGKKALETFLASIPEKRRESLAGKSLEQLMSSKESPLYLLDLKQCLEKYWENDFKNLFENVEKNRFSLMMEDINKFRVDAHCKDIDRDDFEQLRLNFTKLEKALGY